MRHVSSLLDMVIVVMLGIEGTCVALWHSCELEVCVVCRNRLVMLCES